MCCPRRLARMRPSAVRVRIRSRSTSANPPSTAGISLPVLVPECVALKALAAADAGCPAH